MEELPISEVLLYPLGLADTQGNQVQSFARDVNAQYSRDGVAREGI